MNDRDMFAMAAMQGFIATDKPGQKTLEQAARDAYDMADAMLAARGPDKPKPLPPLTPITNRTISLALGTVSGSELDAMVTRYQLPVARYRGFLTPESDESFRARAIGTLQ